MSKIREDTMWAGASEAEAEAEAAAWVPHPGVR